jgi:uncharacterized protein YcbX
MQFVTSEFVVNESSPATDLTKAGCPLKLQQLYVYPVKSCAALELKSCEIIHGKLKHDREWMIKRVTGSAITLRQQPKLALIKTAITELGLRLNIADKLLDMNAKNYTHDQLSNVCGRVESSLSSSESDQADHILSAYLGGSCQLVRCIETRSFANDASFLLINQSSVDAMNASIRSEAQQKGTFNPASVFWAESARVPALCFRPNLIISGTPPFAEMKWKRLRIGSQVFDVVKPCSRCQMISIDPETGQRHTEPYLSLSKHCSGTPVFGIYLKHQYLLSTPPFILRASDTVVITE